MEMAQQLKIFAEKANNPSLIPRSHCGNEKLCSDLHMPHKSQIIQPHEEQARLHREIMSQKDPTTKADKQKAGRMKKITYSPSLPDSNLHE